MRTILLYRSTYDTPPSTPSREMDVDWLTYNQLGRFFGTSHDNITLLGKIKRAMVTVEDHVYKVYSLGDRGYLKEKQAYEKLAGTDITLPGVMFYDDVTIDNIHVSIVDMPRAEQITRPREYSKEAQILREQIVEIVRRLNEAGVKHNDLSIEVGRSHEQHNVIQTGNIVRWKGELRLIDFESATFPDITQHEDLSNVFLTRLRQSSTPAEQDPDARAAKRAA